MTKKINSIITLILTIVILIVFINNSYASFAEFDDATADKQGAEDLKEQQKQDENSVGKSSNNYLANLEVEGYKITPEFDKQIINYSIESNFNENTIKIKATPEDTRATVTGTGTVELQSGENTITVNVKAENNIERSYFIKVNRKVQEGQPKLTKLHIKGVTINGEVETIEISPSFDKEIFKYSCEVYNSITSLELETLSENNSEVKVEGNKELKEGKNIVTITVKKEGEEDSIYKIDVYRKEKNNIESIDTDKSKIVAIITIIIVIIILILLKLINKKKKRKKSSKH